MKIFSGNANKPLAENIAKALSLNLSLLEINVFPDGEKRVRVLDRVVDEDCVVVQPASTPVDHNYMELFFIVDALKRSGAKSVTAVISYLGYERQDHVFRGGEAVSLEVIAKILKTVGVDKVVTFDLHSIKIPEIFEIPVTQLSALPLFAEKIREIISAGPAARSSRDARSSLAKPNGANDLRVARDSLASPAFELEQSLGSNVEDMSNTVLISPDLGGVRRIKLLSGMLNNMPFATIVKNRDLATGEVTAEKIEGLPAGRQGQIKRAIIVDDMISTGSTIEKAAELLEKNGVEEIFVFATHAVFSGNAIEVLQNSKAKKVFVTDTIFVPEKKRFEKLEIINSAKITAQNL